MMNYKIVFIFIFFLITASALFGQSGEEGNDCTYSKEIIVPYNYTAKPENGNINPLLNQTVFYSHRDQFSFWYKIIVKEDALLKIKVAPINDSDTYALFVYQYNQPDFCNKLYFGEISSLKSTFFVEKNAKENPFDLSPKSFRALKGNTYYISVLNTSLTNCGHTLCLVNVNDTLIVKAVHLPCKRDLTSLALVARNTNTTGNTFEKQNTIIPIDIGTKIILPINRKADTIETNVLVCQVKEIKNNSPLKSIPAVINQETGEEALLISTEDGEWRYAVQKEKAYKIKCTLLGYKKTEQIIKIDASLTELPILMEPLKASDNFVMKSIYFYPNTYALKRESADELQKLLNFSTENKNVEIEIQGHTNGDHQVAGNKAYVSLGEAWNFSGNAKKLSQKRAEAIKTYLENNGIHQNRLLPKGYGGKKPIINDPQDNEEGQMNIRVEILILKS